MPVRYAAAILTLALLVSVCTCAQRYYTALAQSAAQQKADASVHASAPVSVHSPRPAAHAGGTLFPGVHTDSITALSVSSQQRRFDFLLDPSGEVSVNGSLGDREIFLTLLEQITQLPVHERSAFSSDGAPILTLTVSCAGARQTVHFYPGERSGEYARIVYDAKDGRHYRQTDAWRVGTLLMTCEGTRIQDESGNEIPAD